MEYGGGRRFRALSELMMKYHASNAFGIAVVYAFRNQPDEAFEWLDRAYAEHDSQSGHNKSAHPTEEPAQ